MCIHYLAVSLVLVCLQAASIQKAINSQECATKEKHARGILCHMSVMYCFQSNLCYERTM